MGSKEYRLDHIRILLKPAAIGSSDHEMAIQLREAGFLSGGYRSQEGSIPTLLDVGSLETTVSGRTHLASLFEAVQRESPVGKLKAFSGRVLWMILGAILTAFAKLLLSLL